MPPDKDVLFVREAPGVKVVATADGHVEISQADGYGDLQIVRLLPAQVPLAIDWLLTAAGRINAERERAGSAEQLETARRLIEAEVRRKNVEHLAREAP